MESDEQLRFSVLGIGEREGNQMKYGEKYETKLVNRITGEKTPYTATYKRVDWQGYHTSNEGDGLWIGDKQIEGTCDFSVSGCKTEKAAKAKIRKYVMGGNKNGEDQY